MTSRRRRRQQPFPSWIGSDFPGQLFASVDLVCEGEAVQSHASRLMERCILPTSPGGFDPKQGPFLFESRGRDSVPRVYDDADGQQVFDASCPGCARVVHGIPVSWIVSVLHEIRQPNQRTTRRVRV